MTTPAQYEFPLGTARDGSGFYAHASVAGASTTNAPLHDWYAVASSADGSQLVVSDIADTSDYIA